MDKYFVTTDKLEKNKLNCFIISLFNEIEYINTHEVDEKTKLALQENTNTILNTINFNKIKWLESEYKSVYTLITEYAREILKIYKCAFTDIRCYDYFNDVLVNAVKNY
jgi:aspartate carbamoyltransferase regulatory subunit